MITAGAIDGRITRVTVWKRFAPRHADASSTSRSSPSSTGCSVRTTNGKPMKTSTSTMPSREYAPWMPSGTRNRPYQPFFTNRLEYTSPATAVGSAKGKSTSESNRRFSGKS